MEKKVVNYQAKMFVPFLLILSYANWLITLYSIVTPFDAFEISCI